MSRAVCFSWHVHPWEELLELVQRAEALGYAAAYVDGDISVLGHRRDADVLDGWTVATSLLARTRRIQIASMRIAHQWNAARLAQCVATAERLYPGRLRFLVSIGDRPGDERFGFRVPPPAERIEWLSEMLDGMRALWRGECVTLRGRHVRLEGARVRPTPPGGRVAIEISARRPRMLEVVARHADVWDVNLPAIPARVDRAAAVLDAACERLGRDPAEIGRSMLVFCRIDAAGDRTRALREYRRLNPWFREVPDRELAPALVVGDPAQCEEQLERLAERLALALPVVDLSGLAGGPTREVLEALAPPARREADARPKSRVDAGT